MDKLEFVGQKEIADMVGVKPPVIANWRTRYPDKFPKPYQTLSFGSIWLKSDIEQYLNEKLGHPDAIEMEGIVAAPRDPEILYQINVLMESMSN